jgi:hypothetical protein
MAEAIMNLSKILEVLFPPAGESRTIEAARAGLKALDYADEQINRDYIPAMALRSNIDSAHVHLSLLTDTQLRVLHAYTEAAELAFRNLLTKIITEVAAKRYEVAQYAGADPDANTPKIVERLSAYFGGS